MKRKIALLLLVLVAGLLLGSAWLLPGPAPAQARVPAAPAAVASTCSGSYCLDWQVMGGVGQMESTSYQLQGTLGQTMAGLFSSDNYNLRSGFWVLRERIYNIFTPIIRRDS